ncbi:nucleotidyltransferase domain-containing protein [bacterium]|nr:nucleotidyltransferase domain-containing protein [bacterium]
MASVIQRLADRNMLNSPPSFLKNGMQLEVIMGSVAYGVSSDTSDMDIYGFAIPSRDYVFPHLRGEIHGFSTIGPQFEQFQQHHINDPEKSKEYDIVIYNITKFFRLCMENNPNMVDALFVPRRCVLYSTEVGELVRENRRLFISKACWPKFKGYAYGQLHKMKTKVSIGKRKEAVEAAGYDLKFSYHVVRLLGEVEQLLTTGDLDLESNREQLKAIRRGDWTKEQVIDYFERKEKDLESAYADSKLPYSANEDTIRALLLKCLEHHYGSIDAALPKDTGAVAALRDIQTILDRTL